MTDNNKNSRNCVYCEIIFESACDLNEHLKLNHLTDLYELIHCKNLSNLHEELIKSDIKLNSKDKLEMAKYEAYLILEGKTDNLNSDLGAVCVGSISTIKIVRDTISYKEMVQNCLKKGVQLDEIKFIEKVQCTICNKIMKNKSGLLNHTRIKHGLTTLRLPPHCTWTEDEIRKFAAIEAKIFKKIGERPLVSGLETKFNKPAIEIDSIRYRDPYLDIFKTELVNYKIKFEAKELEKYQCQFCDKVFDKYIYYGSHYREKHLAADDTTDTLMKTALRVSKIDFAIPKALINRLKEAASDKNVENKENEDIVYSCDICKKKYSTNKTLKRHIRVFHSSPYEDIEAIKVKTLPVKPMEVVNEKNIEAVQVEQPLTCKNCNKSFSKQSKYTKHTNKCVVEKDISVSKSYICEYCSETFKKQKRLKKHIEAIHGLQVKDENAEKDIYNCDDCKTTYMSLENYEKHIETEHASEKAENQTVKKTKKNKRKQKEVNNENAEPVIKKRKA